MSGESQGEDAGKARIMLGLLESVEREGAQSQRRLATDLGVALGLVNAYLKRCVKKGLVKVREVPTRRYAYYLTPQGLAEKSRLTVEYLSYSFSFFREAKADCALICQAARSRDLTRLVLAGKSDLAEIAAICALESGLRIAAVVDAKAVDASFLGFPLVHSFTDVDGDFDAVIVTDLMSARETFAAAIARFGADRVFAPNLLRAHTRKREEVA
jgi:DNA-binding MarR family transcriptional regulator